MSDAALGLARVASVLNRDLQRVAQAAGGPERLWAMPDAAMARVLRLDATRRSALERARRTFDARAERQALAAAEIAFIEGSVLPRRLREIFDPPFGLFGRGAALGPALAHPGPAVAIVGARRAGVAGVAFARRLAGELAERGALVVSGLAQGIDAAAHEGALEADRTTLAILGCGVDVVYPRRNRDLARRVRDAGALVSEYWPGTRPAPWRFPARNRIVSGLAHATVVVEAGARSGALITADFAAEHGRSVLAVPGAPWAALSQGCNELIRSGAPLCTGAEDVVEELGHLTWAAAPAAQEPELSAGARACLEVVARREMTADGLAADLRTPVAGVMSSLSELELAGAIVRCPGGGYLAAAAAPRTP